MNLDFRDAVFTAVEEIMLNDQNVLVLYNDMGAMGLDRIKECFPGRVINAGIAEQNMASVAAGLTTTGKRVFIYGIIAHIFSRGFEQIRNDICCTNQPVVILGVGSGLSYGSDGPTHHGLQDIAVLRTLPNIAIYNPSDSVAAQTLVKLAYNRGGAAYVRMDKEQLPCIHSPETDFRAGFTILHEGNDIVLFSTGVLAHRALQAARQLMKEGVGIRVIDVFRLKPLDNALFSKAFMGVKSIVTLEENSPIGGLGSIIAELATLNGCYLPFTAIGIDDNPMMGATSRKWAETKYGMTLDNIVSRLHNISNNNS
jgi:transketolase